MDAPLPDLLHALLHDWNPERVCLLQAGFAPGKKEAPPSGRRGEPRRRGSMPREGA